MTISTSTTRHRSFIVVVVFFVRRFVAVVAVARLGRMSYATCIIIIICLRHTCALGYIGHTLALYYVVQSLTLNAIICLYAVTK